MLTLSSPLTFIIYHLQLVDLPENEKAAPVYLVFIKVRINLFTLVSFSLVIFLMCMCTS